MATTTDFEKAFTRRSNGGNVEWLRAVRQSGYDRYAQVGFPTRKDEEWKYTSVRPIQQEDFSLVEKAPDLDLSTLTRFLCPNFINLVFIDGVYTEQVTALETLPKGLQVMTLQEAVKERPGEVKAVLEQTLDGQENAFTALNKALHLDGAWIDVADQAVVEPVIHLVYLFSGEHPGSVMSFPRNIIRVGESSKACILQSSICLDPDLTYWTNAMTDMSIAKSAFVEYNALQADSQNAFHVHHTRIHQDEGSHLDSLVLTTGGKLVRNNLAIYLNGTHCHATLDGLYAIRAGQHVDNHTVVDHRYPECTSSQLYKGILDDQSRAVFNGKIFVRQIAQQTNAYQLNRNLLLSPEAEADTKPQLEIFADDVRCTHGATVGQINEDELFYLQSRCIPRERAVNILSHGFAEDVLDRIPTGSVRGLLSGVLNDYFRVSEEKLS